MSHTGTPDSAPTLPTADDVAAARNVLNTMEPQRLRRGVLTASAGNFGLGLVFAAREIDVPSTGEDGVFIHPVAESAVIAGNATSGAEIIEDQPRIDAVVVPFGGGGLACGIGSMMRRLKPEVRMMVAESEAAQPAAAPANGRPRRVPHLQSFVDGMGSTTVLEDMNGQSPLR